MNPKCPYYVAPRYYVNPKTDEDCEGSAMCDLADKYCLMEYGDDCETYQEFLEEDEKSLI